MSDLALVILDRTWTRLSVTPNLIRYEIDEELGSAENKCTVAIPESDHAAAYVPNPDDDDAPSRRFQVYEDGALVFAGLIDKTTRHIDTEGNLVFGGIQRGGELADRNFGRRDMLGWPLPEVLRELLRDNIGRAPFATVTASSERDIAPAINAITGEPYEGSCWSIAYDGSRPSTFVDSETLTVDLGEAKTVHAVRVIPEWWSGKWYQWKLNTSTTGVGYTERYDQSAQRPLGIRGKLVELGGISARYIQIEVYGASDGYPRIAQVMTLQNLAEVGADTTYAVPWIENDDSGNVTVTGGSVTRLPRVGAFPDVPRIKGGRGNEAYIAQLQASTTIEHRFRGTSTAVYFTQEDAATAEVYIDDVLQGEISIPADSAQYKGFEVTGLSNDEHVLKLVRLTGTPEVDYFSGEYASSFRVVQEDEPAIAYYGGWAAQYDDNADAQAYMLTTGSGSEFTYPFYGDLISHIGAKAPSRGIYEYFIDDVSQGTADAYAAVIESQATIFTWSGSYGAHVLRVRNTGTKNASATDIRMDIDRLEGNWAHGIYLRSANDTNLSLIGRLSEMTNSFMRLNYDGTVDLLGALGTQTGEIIREGENEGGTIEEADVEGDFSNIATAILALGKGSDNTTLRSFVFDRTAVAIHGIKVAKIENRDAVDPYLLTRQAWQTLQDSKRPKRSYRATWSDGLTPDGNREVGPVGVGDQARLYSRRLGLTSGEHYRLIRKQTSHDARTGKTYNGQFANKRDRLSSLLTRASRDLSVTTDTPQGFKNVTQYGGNAENFVAETGGSTFRSAELTFFVDEDSFILDAKLRMQIGLYRSYERDTTSGGGSTSGASSASTTNSGGGSTETSTNEDLSHSHEVFDYVDDSPPGVTNREYTAAGPGPGTIVLGTSAGLDINTSIPDVSLAHTHDVTIPSHTHGIPHTHSTPAHTHTQTYDIHEEGSYPGAVSVLIDGTNVDSIIGGPFTASATTNTFDASLTGIISTPGWHTLRFEAASGKGRITPYVIVKSLQLQ